MENQTETQPRPIEVRPLPAKIKEFPEKKIPTPVLGKKKLKKSNYIKWDVRPTCP